MYSLKYHQPQLRLREGYREELALFEVMEEDVPIILDPEGKGAIYFF